MLRRLFIVWFLLCCLASSIAFGQAETAQEKSWNGFAQETFKVADRSAYVVKPNEAQPGNPWIWRARFPNFHAEADLKLLACGYHVAYIDVAGMFGSPRAVEIGDRFYSHMTEQYKLSPYPVLEGVSRGGLFVYNWAAANPDFVSCIYCDTPVCDIRSWPGGKGDGVGAPAQWKQCLSVFGLDETSVQKFNGLPIDQARIIASAGIPALHIVSENDQVVPPDENTYVLATRLKKLGHDLKLIKVAEGTEPSKGHHFTHPCPEKVVQFIRANTKTSISDAAALLKDAKRIVFLGDSITYGGGYVAAFDQWLTSQRLPSNPIVVNVGLGSETVSGLSEKGHAGGRFPRPDLRERLARVLETTKPDLVIACYGINCGIYQPFDEGRFRAYQDGMLWMREQIEGVGGKVVHVTPPIFDDQRSKKKLKYDSVMEKYSDWLVGQRTNGWLVCDLHRTMKNELEWKREVDPKFTFQKDAVHPGPEGHALMGQVVIRWFGGGRLLNDWDGSAELKKLVAKRSQVRRNAYLTTAGHKRPGVPKGVSIEEAEKQAAELTKRIEEILAERK